MAYEMKVGQGSLFKNDRKEKDSHPDLKGKVMLPNGEVRWVSGWSKRTAAGEKWLSISVGDLVGAPAGGQSAHNQAKSNGYVPDDSDIPF